MSSTEVGPTKEAERSPQEYAEGRSIEVEVDIEPPQKDGTEDSREEMIMNESESTEKMESQNMKEKEIEEQIARVTSGVAKRNTESLTQSETSITSIPGKTNGEGGGDAPERAPSPLVHLSRDTRPFRLGPSGHYHTGPVCK